MGGLFDSGPSAKDIKKAEDKAFAEESVRLRLAEKKLRQRESSETIQGQGIATPGNVELGTDLDEQNTGLEEAVGRENPFGQTPVAGPTNINPNLSGGGNHRNNIGSVSDNIRAKVNRGELRFNFGGRNL